MNDFAVKFWGSLALLIRPFDHFAVIFILCFSSVLFLSFVRKVPARFSVIRIIMSAAAAVEGTLFCRQIFESSDPYYSLDFSENNPMGLSFSLKLNIAVIVMAAACAGALLMTDFNELKYNILPIISYQLLTVVVKVFVSDLYNDYLGELIFKESPPQFLNSFWYCCIAIITAIIFLLLLPKSSSASRLKVRYVGINLIVLAVYIFINYEIVEQNDNFISNIFMILYLLTTIVVLALMCYLMKFASDQSNYVYIENQELSEMKSAASYNKRNEALSKYLHDLPKHLDIIQSMAFQNGEEDLASYVRTLMENYYKSRNKFTTGNTRLDELLNRKRTEAEKNNAEIIFSGVFPERVKIRDNDLNAVFSSAIDNAVKNCKGSEEQGKIRISSKAVDNKVVVTVISPRSKADSKHAILGAGSDFSRFRKRIIESTAKAYDGGMTWEVDDTAWKLIFSMKYK